jgi:hypothetical protein
MWWRVVCRWGGGIWWGVSKGSLVWVWDEEGEGGTYFGKRHFE